MSEPLPPVPNVVKLIIEGSTSFLKNWVTIFHWLYTGTPPSASTLLTFATDALNAFQGNYLPITPPSTMINSGTAIDLSTEMMPGITYTAPQPGTSTADKLPANCALLYNWEVAMRYRGGHPRNYIYTGTDENLLNESQWNNAFLTTAATAINTFVDFMNTISAGGTALTGPCMVSYFGGVPTVGGKSQRRAVPLVLPIVMGRVNPFVASQRRRIGRNA